MLNQNFVFLAVAINFIGGLNYLFLTFKGKVQPHRVSWFLWTFIALSAFVAELKQGVGVQSLLTFIAGFNPLLVLIATFFIKKSNWKINSLDIACGVFSILGLILWYISSDANIAIFFSILADGLASLPSLIKSYFHPDTEDYKVFLSACVSAFITLLTINIWTFAYYGFPLYLFLMTLIFTLFIKFKVGKRI